jgi:hypothetical protein
MKSLLIGLATIGYLLVTCTCGAAIGSWSGEKLPAMVGAVNNPLSMWLASLLIGGFLGAVTGALMWFRMLRVELRRA